MSRASPLKPLLGVLSVGVALVGAAVVARASASPSLVSAVTGAGGDVDADASAAAGMASDSPSTPSVGAGAASSGFLALLLMSVQDVGSLVATQARRLDWLSTEYGQPLWDGLLDRYGEFGVTVVGSFLWHEGLYFLFYLPWMIIDCIPAMHKYKIQPRASNTWAEQWRVLRVLLVNHTLIQLPMMLLFHMVAGKLGMAIRGPFPRVSTLLWQVPVFYAIEDFYFYWVHRGLHHRAIYPLIHKVHHENKAPMGMAAEYAHPVETVVLGIGTMLGPLMFARDLATVWVWLVFRLWETVEDHSGYNIPWNPTNLIPFWAGADHHDHHHKTFKGNYASVFVIWDWVFGTDVAWRYPETTWEGRRALAAKSRRVADNAASSDDEDAAAGDARSAGRSARRRTRATSGAWRGRRVGDSGSDSDSGSGGGARAGLSDEDDGGHDTPYDPTGGMMDDPSLTLSSAAAAGAGRQFFIDWLLGDVDVHGSHHDSGVGVGGGSAGVGGGVRRRRKAWR